MKKIFASVLLSALILPTLVNAASFAVISNTNQASYYNIVKKTADRIVALQNANGGFDWVVTEATGPTGSTPLNVTGVTAQVLLNAYTITGDFIITQIDASSPAKINGYNLVFLKNLSIASGISTYADHAATYFGTVYSETPITICASGCNDTNGLYAGYQAYRGWSTTTPNGTVAWDLAGFAEYASLVGLPKAQEIENVIVSNLSVATSTMDNYDLGIASGLKTAVLVGDLANVTTFAGLLSTSVAPYGSSSDGQIQATAYALKALVASNDARKTDAAEYLTTHFNSTFNGWLETDSTEYGEIDGEAASAVALLLPSSVQYYSIQSAVDAATTGDTINIGGGSYTGDVNVTKAVTILGPNATITGNGSRSTEATVTGRFLITSSDVTLKGLTITNPAWSTAATIHGVQVWGGSSALSNVTVSNNIVSGVNNSTNKGSYGIMIQGAVSNSTVSNNKINGITSASGWARGIEVTPTTSTTTVPASITISNNVITSVTAPDAYAFSADASNASSTANALQITLRSNSFIGGNVKNSDTAHTLDAARNFWGVNPTVIRTLGLVSYSPWYTDASMTSVSSEQTTSTTSTAITLTTTPDTTLTTASGTIGVVISASTTVSGPTTWDGIFDLPTATTTATLPLTDNGRTLTGVVAIELGAGDTPLTFSTPVKITFDGQAGKLVGWTRGTTFTRIVTTCNNSTNPTLAEGSDCKIDVGADLVVFTRHATTFVSFTQIVTPASVGGAAVSPSVGTSGGGSSSSSSTGSTVNATTTSAQGAVLGVSTTTVSTPTGTTGLVLGVSTFNFGRNLGFGIRGSDVTELQKMLIDEGYLKISTPTQYFGPLTKSALIKWQAKNKIPATGFFGSMSRGFVIK
jgi:hypothetical protein